MADSPSPPADLSYEAMQELCRDLIGTRAVRTEGTFSFHSHFSSTAAADRSLARIYKILSPVTGNITTPPENADEDVGLNCSNPTFRWIKLYSNIIHAPIQGNVRHRRNLRVLFIIRDENLGISVAVG